VLSTDGGTLSADAEETDGIWYAAMGEGSDADELVAFPAPSAAPADLHGPNRSMNYYIWSPSRMATLGLRGTYVVWDSGIKAADLSRFASVAGVTAWRVQVSPGGSDSPADVAAADAAARPRLTALSVSFRDNGARGYVPGGAPPPPADNHGLDAFTFAEPADPGADVVAVVVFPQAASFDKKTAKRLKPYWQVITRNDLHRPVRLGIVNTWFRVVLAPRCFAMMYNCKREADVCAAGPRKKQVLSGDLQTRGEGAAAYQEHWTLHEALEANLDVDFIRVTDVTGSTSRLWSQKDCDAVREALDVQFDCRPLLCAK
jgi:hypothetical protein